MFFADRVLETTTTTGTGDITPAGAVAGYRTFTSIMSASDTFPYALWAVDGAGVPTGDWEVGLGTWSGTAIARTSVRASSNSDSPVNFAAGTKHIAVVVDGFTMHNAVAPQLVTHTTTSKSTAIGDTGAYIRFTNAGAKTYTIEPNATTPLQVDAEIVVHNVGAGDLTLVAGSGVTLNAPAGGSLVIQQNSTATIKKVATDEFDITGQTVRVGDGWQLVEARAMTTNANEDFTGLGVYQDLLVICSGITASVSGARQMLLSVDGGATYNNTSGDYVGVAADGTTSTGTGIGIHSTNATAARSGMRQLTGNVDGTIKMVHGANRTDAFGATLFVASTAVVDAVRITNSGGGNLTGGTIYVLGRR